MSDHVPFTIIDRDEVNLLAVLRCMRESQVQVREVIADMHYSEPEAQREMDRSADRRAADTLGGIAGRACARFEGERKVSSDHREAKERCYSMYAMHPDTAEQIMQALEFLVQKVGPRFQAHTAPRKFEPKTVRNDQSA